jgi:hypothetical protein
MKDAHQLRVHYLRQTVWREGCARAVWDMSFPLFAEKSPTSLWHKFSPSLERILHVVSRCMSVGLPGQSKDIFNQHLEAVLLATNDSSSSREPRHLLECLLANT